MIFVYICELKKSLEMIGIIVGTVFAIIAIGILCHIASCVWELVKSNVPIILMFPVLPFIYAYRKRKEYPIQSILIFILWSLFYLTLAFGITIGFIF